jgi:Flp pilus assembly CpaF family ATPase
MGRDAMDGRRLGLPATPWLAVVRLVRNPDRTLWIDRLSSGRAPMGAELSEEDGERIIRLVAAHVGAEVHRGQPLLTAELPETGERFEGILPPAAPGPAFALRKRAVGVIPLERYIADGMMSVEQAAFLRDAVRERQNILIAGGTSTGKTTLANALLAEIAATGTEHWDAVVSIVLQTPRTEQRLRKNPLGIYVNGLSWSRELDASQGAKP